MRKALRVKDVVFCFKYRDDDTGCLRQQLVLLCNCIFVCIMLAGVIECQSRNIVLIVLPDKGLGILLVLEKVPINLNFRNRQLAFSPFTKRIAGP